MTETMHKEFIFYRPGYCRLWETQSTCQSEQKETLAASSPNIYFALSLQ